MEVNIAICDDDENSLELIEKEIKNAAKTLFSLIHMENNYWKC